MSRWIFAALLLPLAAPALAATLAVKAPAFLQGADLPIEYTCSSENASPQIVWGRAPSGTESFAIIVDDPDGKNTAGAPWVHWVVFNIPSTDMQLQRNVLINDPHFKQGANDFGDSAWGGPCPPEGKGAHRYYFRVYALDTTLALPSGAPRADVDTAMKGHVLASGALMGRFGR